MLCSWRYEYRGQRTIVKLVPPFYLHIGSRALTQVIRSWAASAFTCWAILLSQWIEVLNMFWYISKQDSISLIYLFWDKVSLWCTDCPGTHYEDQVSFKLRDPPPASASWKLQLKVGTTMPGHHSLLKYYHCIETFCFWGAGWGEGIKLKVPTHAKHWTIPSVLQAFSKFRVYNEVTVEALP